MAYGTHYTDTLVGRVFSQAATPLGLALPIYTATAIVGGLPIWNPPGSNVNVELISVDFPWASGTAGIAAVGLMCGTVNSIATGSGMSAMATTTAMNGYLLGGIGSKVSSSNAGTVTVTAGTAAAPVAGVAGAGWTRALASINLENSTTTPLATNMATYQFNGSVLIPPGVLAYFASTVASVALYGTCVVWKELPIAPPLV